MLLLLFLSSGHSSLKSDSFFWKLSQLDTVFRKYMLTSGLYLSFKRSIHSHNYNQTEVKQRSQLNKELYEIGLWFKIFQGCFWFVPNYLDDD